ncbi:MAG: patatin-like phospholipase family protein [Candidatus Thermoplasmatota archaeon]|nr:patatin-like phospholipase family protein [Candidatus Thermoplasmatota archaeon]
MNQINDKKNKILACSGGGAHTTSYIGFWRYVFDEHNYSPDYIVGTSGGALFGCFMAAGLTSKEMEEAFLKYKPWKFFRVIPWLWLRDFIRYWGLVRIKKIQRLLERIFCEYDINWDSFSKTEFQCVVTDLNEGKRMYIPQDMDMDLSTAIAASIAIPGIFEPVWVEVKDGVKHCFVDGGVCEGYPIKAALQQGRDNIKILAISPFDVTQKRQYSFNGKLQYARTLYRTLLDAKGEDLINLLDEDLGDYYLPTGFNSEHVLDFDWDTVKTNIDIGYNNAKNKSNILEKFFRD